MCVSRFHSYASQKRQPGPLAAVHPVHLPCLLARQKQSRPADLLASLKAQLAALSGAGFGHMMLSPGNVHLKRYLKPCSACPCTDGAFWLSGRVPSRCKALAGHCLPLLLQACGIGNGDGGSSASSGGDTGPPHRVLVFAQLRSLLDIVEADVLQAQGITYLRLDGR